MRPISIPNGAIGLYPHLQSLDPHGQRRMMQPVGAKLLTTVCPLYSTRPITRLHDDISQGDWTGSHARDRDHPAYFP